MIIAYFLVSYFITPFFWKHYEHHRELENEPKRTQTKESILSDPVNIGFVTTSNELLAAFERAGWSPADPLSFRSDLKIITSVLFKRPYPQAPLSKLYLYGRSQDLAFEKEISGTPRKRHHVRLWQSPLTKDGRPVWIGSATFDKNVGLSRNTGKITHHVDADIDKERDYIIKDLTNVLQLAQIYQVTGIGPTLTGYNGSRDRYFTDGEMTIGVISPGNTKVAAPELKQNPTGIKIKNDTFDTIRRILSTDN